ncbi:MATE family efflux transporter [Fusobacterium sp. PH5-44]|uniref:MATE family efflux transporter n=1 Tax=unclassified Fusobacterium TaxID=2648384 RepID=UPI003D1FBF7B
MNKNTAVDILNGPIWKQLLIFFFPILLGTFFQQIYNTTDTVIVGNFVGKEALAAVGGSPFYIINLFIGFSIGLSSGASVIISQFYGSKKNRPLSESVHTSIAFSCIIGLVLTIITIIFGRQLLIVLKVPTDSLEHSLRYLNIISIGFIFSMLYNMGTAIFRAIGDTKKPLYFLIISCITNIVLDLFFVVYLKQGVVGVAIATVISQFISVVLTFYSLSHVHENYKLSFRKIKITPIILLRILKISLPRGLQSALFSLSNIIIQSSVNQLGTDYVAGWTVDTKIEQVFWMVSSCFGVAITTFTAQNFGARKYDRVKNGLKICTKMTLITAIFISTLIYILGPRLVHLFTNDQSVIAVSIIMLRTLSPFYILYIGVEMIAGFLYGIGISIIPMIITASGICAFRILWVATIVGNKPTLYKVISCYPISWALTSIIFIIYYKYSKSKKYLLRE